MYLHTIYRFNLQPIDKCLQSVFEFYFNFIIFPPTINFKIYIHTQNKIK